MNHATREIVERLAKEADMSPPHPMEKAPIWLATTDDLCRFWVLAMEHAAGICEAERSDDGRSEVSKFDCAAAIREAAK